MPQFLYLVLAGVGAGALAGYLGIGGGIVYLPVLMIFLPRGEYFAQRAVGTSLTTILLTSISSAIRHYIMKHIALSIVGYLALGSLFGAVLGSTIARYLSSGILSKLIAAVLVIVAAEIVFTTMRNDKEKPKPLSQPSPFQIVLVGGAVAFIATTVGIGGGVFLVPYLIRRTGLMPSQAAGTSALKLCVTSAVGVICYILHGKELITAPWHLGFVDIKSVLFLAIGAIPGAQLGAYLHRFPRPRLFYAVFSAILILAAVKIFIR